MNPVSLRLVLLATLPIALVTGAGSVWAGHGPAAGFEPSAQEAGSGPSSPGNNSTAVQITPHLQARTVAPGNATTYNFTVTNLGAKEEQVLLNASAAPLGWSRALDATDLVLAPHGSAVVHLVVGAPLVPLPPSARIYVTASLARDPSVSDTAETVTSILVPLP